MGELEPGGYTLSEAAVRLNCHRNTVENMIRAKQLRIYRVGKRGIRVTKESIDQRLAGEKVRK
jgi:excisionase family DNA binding protein